MGKHLNAQQEDMIIDFMEKHQDLARGFTKGDRIEIDKLWQTLADNLNSVGPPIKKPDAWKKAWSDKKTQLKRKLAINKRESRATGGGPHNQLYISSRDEAIGKICGLYDIVDGIGNSISYGFQCAEETDDQSPESPNLTDTEHVQEELQEPTTSSRSRKRKTETHTLQQHLKKFMSDETTFNAETSKTLIKLQSTMEGNEEILRNLDFNTKRMYKALDKMSERLKEQIKATNAQTEELAKQRIENERHHKEMEKLAYEKNTLKQKLLEIQKEQLNMYKF